MDADDVEAVRPPAAAGGGALEGIRVIELGQLLAGPAAHTGVARIDWRRATGGRSRPYTLFDDLAPAAHPAAGPVPARPVAELVELTLADRAQGRHAVLDELLARLGPLLGLTEADRDALRPVFTGSRLSELGFDSLTTIRLRNQLLADYSVDLAPELLFGGGTAGAIAGQICQQLPRRSIIAAAGAVGRPRAADPPRGPAARPPAARPRPRHSLRGRGARPPGGPHRPAPPWLRPRPRSRRPPGRHPR